MSGQVKSLRDATGARGAFGDVEALSLTDATIAGATQVTRGRYALCVPPAPYALVSRAERLAGGRHVQSSALVAVTHGSSRLDVAKSVKGLILGKPAEAATAGGVVGIQPMPFVLPDGWRNDYGATAEGPFVTGFVDPCRKAGRKVLDLDPGVATELEKLHRLADAGRATPMAPLNIPAPETTISGKVTVGEDGKPVADLTVRDAATGEVIDHIIVPGEPGSYANDNGIGDGGKFMRDLGSRVAERECKKKPPPTTAPSSTRPSSASSVPPSSSAAGTGRNVLVYSGKMSGSVSLATDGSMLTANLTWSEQATSPGNDPSVVTRTFTQISGSITVTSPSNPGINCSAQLTQKPGGENVLLPEINHLVQAPDYVLDIDGPADGLRGSQGPPDYQVQSSSSDPNSDCGDVAHSFDLIERFPTDAEYAKVVAALHPKLTVPPGRSDSSFNYSNSTSTNNLSVISDVMFDGT